VSADETVVALRSPMPVSAEALFAWHERPGAFERLTPGFQPATVVARSGGIRDGSRVTLRVPVGPASTTWEMEHVGYVAGREFRDVQVRGVIAVELRMERERPEARRFNHGAAWMQRGAGEAEAPAGDDGLA